jgi:aspartyl-tRNA synthetase
MNRSFIKESLDKTGEKIKIAGWVEARRDHGKLIFIDLIDKSGIMQVVFSSKTKELFALAEELRKNYVIEVKGVLRERPESMVNSEIESGKVEVSAEDLKILSKAETPPFDESGEGYEINEELRLKYRYLDLRRPRLKKNLEIRHKVKNFTRQFLTEKGFTEIDTPILTKATPEGARDFLVPSRHYRGKFYALPQSPQQYKQILMVAGIERYFQFGRCFRDEDLRADRVLEFDQWDIEMSFVEEEDILSITESLATGIVENVLHKRIQEKPFPRITYDEAMEKYGRDNPDFRENADDKETLAFVWVTDFPMFERKKDGSIGPAHHPFTAIRKDDLHLLENPEKLLDIRARQYDLVLNGNEVFGGSIRTHDPNILLKVFEILGHSKEEIQERFGHLLEAFGYGVPPHGGIAGGFARFLMAALGEKSIREVIPFPTTGQGMTSVMDAPSEVDKEQLEELGIEIKKFSDKS